MPPISPFFVVGSDRSGTTMLRLMLNAHGELYAPPETHFFSDLMDVLPLTGPLSLEQVATAHQIMTSHRRWRDLEMSPEECAAILAGLEAPGLADVLQAVFSNLSKRHGKKRWGDKTPDYVVELERLATVFPAAKFIHVIRDGRDVCLSLLEKGWRGTSPSAVGRYWSHHVGTGVRVGRSLPRDSYFEVHYEGLVLDTEPALREVCDFLGVPFYESMLRFYEQASGNVAAWQRQHHEKTTRPPRPSDVTRWKREATPYQVIAFEAYAKNTMEATGYNPQYAGAAATIPRTFALLEGVARWIKARVTRSQPPIRVRAH